MYMNYVDLKDEIVKRLKSLGYEVVQDKDDFLLEYIFKKVEQDIKNKTNQSEVPDGLHYVLIERICGEFLNGLYSTNLLSETQIDSVVASIKEGDTQVSFDVNSSPQAIFKAYISRMTNYGNDDFAKYRKFVW